VLPDDPGLKTKSVDLVGRYLNRTERAAVFSFDQATRCQAPDRTLRLAQSGTFPAR
jgi:hypothetical protein